MIEWKRTKDAKFVDMVPYLFRHKRTEEEMKFADIIYEDVVGYFIEKKGVLYFKGGCGDYMLSDTTVEIMKENYELYTSVLQ